jgi:hypothetical protein
MVIRNRRKKQLDQPNHPDYTEAKLAGDHQVAVGVDSPGPSELPIERERKISELPGHENELPGDTFR